LFLPHTAHAIYDPSSVANNPVGVHILSPDEVDKASELVNNSGRSQWGYVTVPIQSTDRDKIKWTNFMVKAYQKKVIPIIRIATFVDSINWAEPNNHDLIDFANFLNELPWPTKNRYIVVFNEVNRSDEFGGSIKPKVYAAILNNAITIFKERSDDFFILPAGLDNAANTGPNSTKWNVYLSQMEQAVPGIFDRIDGWTSHAYPNPAFVASPRQKGENKLNSYDTDLRFIFRFSKKDLPIFITETGWDQNKLGNDLVGTYYDFAFKNVWVNPKIITITPFLLFAGTPPFEKFSLLNRDFSSRPSYLAIQRYARTGEPLLNPPPTPIIQEVFSGNRTSSGSLETIFKGNRSDNLGNFITRLFSFFKKSQYFNVIVGGKEYQAEEAVSISEKAVGLAKYSHLEQGRAMLFRFPKPDKYPFWMKNMKFDIDIVWIRSLKVIAVNHGDHLDPNTLIYPPEKIDTVLEVSPDSGIKPGDLVQLP